MFPTLHLGFIVLPTYTVLVDLGLVAGLIWLWRRAPAQGREPGRWLDAGLSALAGGVVGGRLAFAFANWAYFQNHVVEIFRLWEGGYAWLGVVGGGLLGLWGYCQIRREPFASLLDELAPIAPLIAALGWVGCAAASCGAGLAVPPGVLPFAVNWPDLYGVVLPRWPTQVIGFGLSAISLGYLITQRNTHWPKGFRFALSFMLVAISMFLISGARGDDMPLVGQWRLDLVANAIAVGLGLIGLTAAWALEPARPIPEPQINADERK